MVRAIDATQAETRVFQRGTPTCPTACVSVPYLPVPAVVAGSAVVRCLWLRQLCVLVRNNLVGMLRRYVATFIEVLLMTVILMGIDKEAVVREPMRRHAATVYPTMPPTAYWNSSDSVDIREVWFAPESDYTARLTRIACRKLRVPKVSAASSAEQLAEKVTKHNATPATVTVVGLLFSGLTPNDSDPKTLHVSFYSGNLPMDIKLSYKERLLSEPEGPVDERRFPEMTTLLPIMGVLQQTHLELQAKIAGRTEPLAMPALRRFPYPAYLEYNDPNNYSLVFTRFCIGMLVPFALFVALVAEERASGKKELLRVTGVNDWVYWLGHVISGILKHLVTSAIMLVFLVVRRNDQNRAFIQYSNPLLVFLVLMCFCVSCRVHAALLSALIETPHTAMAMAMLLWTLLSAIPYLALEHPSGLGYQYIRRREKLGTAVFPGMNLHWSLRVLERFEKFVEHGANWGNFYDHDVTLDNVTLAELMFVGLAYNAVLGLTLWYLDNVLPVGPGVHRSPLFPFEFHYWMPVLTDVEAVPKVGKEKQNFEAVGSNLPVAVELYHVSKKPMH
ncbi:phospholipid-transporting ATPase ABCA3-like [Haemaphysalis longicornis]